MKIYAVIHGVCGLYEGYSDTTCEFFPTEEAAQKHVKQCLDTYREDEMCVNIDHFSKTPSTSPWTATLTTTRLASHQTWSTTTTLQSTWTT